MKPSMLLAARTQLIAGGAALAFACARQEAPRADRSAAADTAQPPEEAVARARAAANGLGQELQAKLFAALDSGGPERAIAICADSAQAWTERHAREGVYVRRVSLRVRNPRNQPDAREALELQRFDSLHRAGATPGEILRSARTADGQQVVEYMRPIIVQERCLACHGDPQAMSLEVRALLDARYPGDQATGYRTGDLRGALSVRVPMTATGGPR
jgi:hypothetical protein